jgi:hypothetical protein
MRASVTIAPDERVSRLRHEHRLQLAKRLGPRRRPWHPVAVLRLATVLAAIMVLTAGWTTGEPVLRYSNELIAFSHPRSWDPYDFPPVFHWRPIVYLSTQPLHDPCQRNPESTRCAWPVDRLGPRGVLASWWVGYRTPGFKFSRLPGTRIVVGGRTAKLISARPGICRQIGGEETITVRVSKPGLDFQACLRGPGLRSKERQVRALLGTTIFH